MGKFAGQSPTLEVCCCVYLHTDGCHVPGGRDKGRILTRELQCAGECRWQRGDRDKTGELKPGEEGGPPGRGGRHRIIENQYIYFRGHLMCLALTKASIPSKVEIQVATCRSGDKAEEEEKEEAGDHQGGKTNLDIHRSGEQSPPGETMAVINKGWQSELSINRQTPSPASSEPISMLNKPTISFPLEDGLVGCIICRIYYHLYIKGKMDVWRG